MYFIRQFTMKDVFFDAYKYGVIYLLYMSTTIRMKGFFPGKFSIRSICITIVPLSIFKIPCFWVSALNFVKIHEGMHHKVLSKVIYLRWGKFFYNYLQDFFFQHELLVYVLS